MQFKSAEIKIKRAREKYGVLNFEYNVIFRVESFIKSEVQDILNEKEVQYIELFDSFNNGYNSDPGGNSAAYIRTEETKKKNSKATKEFFKNHKSHVARAVLQYTIEGDFIAEWDSARSAAKSINKEGNTITNVCNGKRNHAHGFIWRYKDEFKEIPQEIEVEDMNCSIVPVKQYTLDGEFIKEWKTITEAAQELGYSVGNFSTYCNGRNEHIYKGFKYYRKQYPK